MLCLALSPLTGAKRLAPSIVLGLAGGVLLMLDRLRRPAPHPAPALAPPTALVWGALGLAALVFAPTGLWLFEQYTESVWRTPHGLFVPIFLALLVRHRLREAPPEPQASLLGLPLVLLGAGLAVADAGMRSHYVGLAGLLVGLPGLSLLLLGTETTRALALPLVLSLFLIPLPDGLPDPGGLPTLSAIVGETLTSLSGTPVRRAGTFLELSNGLLIEVSQNCSGLSFFYAGCAFAALCASAARSWPRRLAILVSPYVLAVLGNGVRVAFLLAVGGRMGLDWKYDTPLHGILGTAVCLGVLLGVWLVADRRALREAIA